MFNSTPYRPKRKPYICPNCGGRLIVPNDDDGRPSADLWFCPDCSSTWHDDEITEFRRENVPPPSKRPSQAKLW